MSIYNDLTEKDWDFDREVYVKGKKFNLPVGPLHPHYPNAAERKKIRQLMAKNKMTEAEVKNSISFRREIAAAQHADDLSRISLDERISRIARRQKLLAKRAAKKQQHLLLLQQPL